MNLLLCGNGKMGQMLAELITQAPNLSLMAVIGPENTDLLSVLPAADAVLDFSAPEALSALATYIRRTGAPLVSGTTGLSPSHFDLLRNLAEVAPILHSANYSLGVAVFRRILPQIRAALGGGFDIELVETHHREKVDAPSGTAKLLLSALDSDQALTPVYGRTGGKRQQGEIGVHAIRGGTVAGEHTVSFYGEDEVFSITHSASSRRIFASGALQSAQKLAGHAPGWYTLDDIL